MRSEDVAAARAGLFVIVCAGALLASVFVLGQRSELFQDQYTLRTTFGNVQGLAVRAPVRMAGVEVGSVDSVSIPEGIRGTNVVVTLKIRRRYEHKIRKDSVASIRTLGALGDKYVEVSIGSMDAPVLKEGEDLKSYEPIDFYDIAEQGKQILVRVLAVVQSLDTMLTEFEKSGTIKHIGEMSASMQAVLSGIEKGPGAVHTLVFDADFNTILVEARKSVEGLRKVIDQLSNPKEGLGALLYSEEVAVFIKDLRDAAITLKGAVENVDKIVGAVREGDGLMHALVFDPKEREALRQVGTAIANLNKVVARVANGEGTMGLLISDPAVYDSIKRLLGGAEQSTLIRILIGRGMAAQEKEAKKRKENAGDTNGER